MENNLVELKFDRVNEYFEKFKKEYDDYYEENKEKGTRTVIPYHMLIGPSVMTVINLIAVCSVNFVFSEITKTNSNEISGSVHYIYEVISSWIMPMMAIFSMTLLVVTFIRMFSNSYETTIEYTKNEYYRKIKSRMLNKLRTELHDSITESMLVFDTTGMIVSPNLSTNENKKIFSEAERRLKEWKTV